MIVYAHRGWHGEGVAENSPAAFARAAAAGVGIETDLRTTRDGRLVLFHDRVVGDLAVDELDARDLDRLAGRAVPLLDDLLAARWPVPLNLEVKTVAAWAALRPELGRLPGDVLISSFIHAIAVAAAAEGREAAYLLASCPADASALPKPAPRLATVVWDFAMTDPALPARARALGLRTIVYGARTVAEHALLGRIGCDAIITDTPDRVIG